MTVRYAAFVRHGDYHQQPDTPSALQPWPLTDKGKAQARQCADRLAEFAQQLGATIAPVMHSSQMRRAWETASIIAEGLPVSLALESTGALAERSVGAAANLTVAQIGSILADDPRYSAPPQGWKGDSHYCLPFQGAESLMQAGQRVADYVASRVARSNEGEMTIFVGHGAAFRHAACTLGVLDPKQVRALSMFHARPVILELSSNGHWNHILGDWKNREFADQPMD